MSDDLPIKISLDPTQAVGGAKKVTDEVAKTEAQAAKAKAAFEALGKSFSGVADAMRQQTASALSNTAKGFDSLTEAIRREQAVLERIHGPAKRYADDLKTLDSMLARNTVTTKQYADEVARLNRQLADTAQAETKVRRGQDILAAAGGGTAGAANGNLSSIASGVGALNLKQAAAGAGQAFQLLNEKLKITDTAIGSVIGSAVKFGAAGAQIAGPWGAAVGALVGVVSDLASSMFDAEAATKKLREETEKAGKAYWDGIKAAEQKKRIEEELAPVLAEHARQAQQIAEREATVNQVMNGSVTAYRQATDRALAYADQLHKVNAELAVKLRLESKLYGADPTAGGPQTDDESTSVKAQRGLRDATIESYAATKSYAAALVDLEAAENKKQDRQRDLEQIMGDINVSQAARTAALKEYNKTIKDNVEKTTAQVNQMDALRAAVGNYGRVARNAEWAAEDEANRPENLIGELGGGKPIDVNQGVKVQGDNMEQFLAKNAEDWEKAAQEARKVEESTQKISDIMAGELVNAAASFSSTLVDAANGADVSWKAWGESMLDSLQKAIVKALILKAITGSYSGAEGASGWGGLMGMAGFASGGTIYPSGGGTADTQAIAFRKRPDETVHINTPQQERAYQQGSGGGSGETTVRVVSDVDRRRLYSHKELLVDIGRNRDAIRRLIG